MTFNIYLISLIVSQYFINISIITKIYFNYNNI